jgi:hypothetical protein
MMRALVSNLTAFSVLLHVLLGCHAHHVRAAETTSSPVEVSHASNHCCHHHESQSESPTDGPELPCEDESCDFAVVKVDAPSLDDDQAALFIVPLQAEVIFRSAEFHATLALGAVHDDVSLSVLYCVLRN